MKNDTPQLFSYIGISEKPTPPPPRPARKTGAVSPFFPRKKHRSHFTPALEIAERSHSRQRLVPRSLRLHFHHGFGKTGQACRFHPHTGADGTGVSGGAFSPARHVSHANAGGI